MVLPGPLNQINGIAITLLLNIRTNSLFLFLAVMNKFTEDVPIHRIKTKEMQPFGFDVININVKNGGRAYDSSVLHRHTFFELFLFTGGKGLHEVDFQYFDTEPFSVHFVSPGQIHNLHVKSAKGYVVCFNEDFVSLDDEEDFVEKFPFYDGSSPPVMKLDKELATEIESLILSVAKELHVNSKNTELCRSYLNIILLKLRDCFTQGKNPGPSIAGKKKKVTQFKKFINDNYLKHVSVSDYASLLNITPNHLNALCKKYEGRTAIQLIQERLLLESKRLLYATDMNIKEISYHLRFEDVPYFNRFFKKLTELTPIQYRERFQKNH
jgi:AraC family transcriptional regulator, transcriptional activator of pobA